jgi:hypothetical protein
MTDLERDLGGYEYARSVTIDLNDPAPALAEIKIYLTQVAPAVGARGRI